MSLPLAAAVAQCVRHATVMQVALAELPAHLDEGHLNNATPERVRLIDQFVLRYIKLQDTLGTHVLRQFAAGVLQEPVEDAAFIDVLNLLERRGFLGAAQWATQRSLRNALTHEYPDDPARQAAVLAAAQAAAQELSGWLRQIEQRLGTSARAEPSAPNCSRSGGS